MGHVEEGAGLGVKDGAPEGVETLTGTAEPHASLALAGTDIAQGSLCALIGEQAWREANHFQESGGTASSAATDATHGLLLIAG